MRNIKFNIWDTKEEYMNGTWEGIYDFKEKRWRPFMEIEKDGFILLQYTGMDDDEGEEIWEGDIIEMEYISGTCKGHKQIRVVEYNNESTCFYPTVLWGIFPDQRKEFTARVIGNIYEDSDLLESMGYPTT